jgi:ankyrin repeat protein
MAMANNPDIYLATKAGDFERVKYLVEVEDVNINRMDDHNSVPLFYACLCGHTGKLA